MSFITREELLAPDKRRYKDFEIDGRTFRVRSLMENERANFEVSTLNSKGGFRTDRLLSARRRLVCLTLVNESNDLLLQPSDVRALEAKDGALVERIYQEAAAHCGIRDEDIEGLVGNSNGTADA